MADLLLIIIGENDHAAERGAPIAPSVGAIGLFRGNHRRRSSYE